GIHARAPTLKRRLLALLAFVVALPCVAQRLDDNLRAAGFTELHEAAWNGDVARIRSLVGNGANVNVAASSGTTPLHSAAIHGEADAIRVLVALGADVE